MNSQRETGREKEERREEDRKTNRGGGLKCRALVRLQQAAMAAVALLGVSSPVGVPISVVVTQKVILSHHLVSGDFQWLVNRRQEIFT